MRKRRRGRRRKKKGRMEWCSSRQEAQVGRERERKKGRRAERARKMGAGG